MVVYFVLGARVTLGLSALLVVALWPAPATFTVPPATFTLKVVVVRPVTLSLKVAVTLASRDTPSAPEAARLLAMIVGRGPVVNVQLTGASRLPAASLIALVAPRCSGCPPPT